MVAVYVCWAFLSQPSTIAAVCSTSPQRWNSESLVFQQPLDFSRWRTNVLRTMRLRSSVTMMHCFRNSTQEKRCGLLVDSQRRRRPNSFSKLPPRDYFPVHLTVNFFSPHFHFSHLLHLLLQDQQISLKSATGRMGPFGQSMRPYPLSR